jgi:hypothetical protein
MKSKHASPNSKPSRASKKPAQRATGQGSAGAAFLFLAVVSAAAAAFAASRGWTLWFGDAQAHLNIARRIFDSRTPGYEQFGTVWLPLPHIAMMPFARIDSLWRSGIAGVIPTACAFVLAGLFLFLAVRRIFQSAGAAWAALIVFTVNPNLLYLQATPMTEAYILACWLALLHFTLRFRDTQVLSDVFFAGLAAAAGTLTRYEGWILVPCAALYILLASKKRGWAPALLFLLFGCLGPLYWFAHNFYYYSDPLEFYRGPYSAKAIYQRAIDAGGQRYPGDHDWRLACAYYFAAARLCLGTPLIWIGAAGALAALLKRAWWPVILLSLVPVFYILSLYTSGTPIFVPTLWPNSWYNTRYGIHALPLAALGAAALVSVIPARIRWTGVIIPLAAVALWFGYPRAENWICWKESQVNSESRRAWTQQAAAYLQPRYHPGAGIFTSFGDLAGIYRTAGIPIRETLHEGNGPAFLAAQARPDLVLFEEWAICISGDTVCQAVSHIRGGLPRFERVRVYAERDQPHVEIWRRIQ